MSIHIRLDKPINQKQVLQQIQNQINEHRKSNRIEDSILSIDIKNVSHVVDGCLDKLENTLEKLND